MLPAPRIIITSPEGRVTDYATGNIEIFSCNQDIVPHGYGEGACEGFMRLWMADKARKKKLGKSFNNLGTDEPNFKTILLSMPSPVQAIGNIMGMQESGLAGVTYETIHGTTPAIINAPDFSDVAIRNNYRAITARNEEMTGWASGCGLKFIQSCVEVNFVEPLANVGVELARKHGGVLAVLGLQGKSGAHAVGFSIEDWARVTPRGYYLNIFDPNSGEVAYHDPSNAPHFFVAHTLTSFIVNTYPRLQDLIYCQYFIPA